MYCVLVCCIVVDSRVKMISNSVCEWNAYTTTYYSKKSVHICKNSLSSRKQNRNNNNNNNQRTSHVFNVYGLMCMVHILIPYEVKSISFTIW